MRLCLHKQQHLIRSATQSLIYDDAQSVIIPNCPARTSGMTLAFTAISPSFPISISFRSLYPFAFCGSPHGAYVIETSHKAARRCLAPQGVLNRVTPCSMHPLAPSPRPPTGTSTVVWRFEHNLFPIATPSDTVAPLSFCKSVLSFFATVAATAGA